MLSCLLNDKRINCYDYDKDTLKKWANKNILICPACGKPYEYCHGKIISPYFRHKDKEECIDKYSEAETEEHKIGKQDLYEWIKKQDGVTDVILEGWIAKTKQRPDIMFKYNGEQYVIEFQCSPIATEYYERHELYRASGIKDIWILGTEKYLDSSMRDKVIEEGAYCYYNSKDKNFIINSNNGMFDSFNIIYKKGKFGFTKHTFKNQSRLIAYSCDINNLTFENGEIINRKLKMKLKDSPEDIFIKRSTRKELNKELNQIRETQKFKKIKNINNNYYGNKNIKISTKCTKYEQKMLITLNFKKYSPTIKNNYYFDCNKPIYLQANEFINKSKERYEEELERIDKIDRSIYYFSKENKSNGLTILLDKGRHNEIYNCKYKKVISDYHAYLNYNFDEIDFLEYFISSLQFLKKNKFKNTIMLPSNCDIYLINNYHENILTIDENLYNIVGYLYLKGFKNIEVRLGD